MLKIVEKIAQKLDLKSDEVLEKLGLKNDSTIDDLKTVLGVYSIFENKTDHQNYLNQKIGHQTNQINDLKKQLEETNLAKDNYANLTNNYQTEMTKIINSEWKKIGGKKEIDIKSLSKDFDYSNINKSLLKYADENQIAIPKNNNTNTTNYTSESNNAKASIVDGVVL